MKSLEVAVRVTVDLLVRGQYRTAEKVTRGHRLTADQISSAISAYGHTLVPPGDEWWSSVEITAIDTSDRPAFHVAAPLWTREEDRPDLTLELQLTEVRPGVYETEILDIHLL